MIFLITDIISSLNLSSTIETEKLGRKASALIKLKREGINVPDFICIPISILQKLFSELEVDSKGAESQALISEIKNFTSSLNAPFFAIRSSTTAEDGVDFSGAGQEATHLHVAEVDVLTAIEGVLNEITKEGNRTIGGSIIVQRMIFGEYSGVLFSKHPFDESLREATVIETAMGGNEHLTSGRISPTRYIVLNGHVHDYQKGDKWGGECNESLIQKLEKTAHQIEDLFGAPQDIEWTTANNQLYILQSRNITGNKQIGASNIYTRVKEEKQTCIAIYQKYVLPIVLQNHLLRVAAVGKWIIDHWEDPNIVLDETLIIETLLLHDIGNIVKGEDENFINLFPDTYPMESFNYWITVRKWVAEHYGKVDTEATKKIVKEIGVNEKVQDMIDKKQFTNNVNTYESNDFNRMICAYADQRVSPSGIMSLTGRLGEAIKRYQGVKSASVNSKNRKILMDYAKKIESRIFEHVNGTSDMITDNSVDHYFPQLKAHVFINLNIKA